METNQDLIALKCAFEERSSLSGINYEIKERSDGKILIMYLANPTERFYRILEDCLKATVGEGEVPSLMATLKKSAAPNLLKSAEGRLLQRTLVESLNINRHSFKDDFFARYTKSVSGAEEQIVARANNIVFGRRGAGKSSLLLYGSHMSKRNMQATIWVDMQVYSGRQDSSVAIDLFLHILKEVAPKLSASAAIGELKSTLEEMRLVEVMDEVKLRKLLPRIREVLSEFGNLNQTLMIYLDDYHVIGKAIQHRVLDFLYSVTRGNNIYIKISAIESLTQTYDSATKAGMQIQHDITVINLDYNLTMPEKATEHITSILDAHASYCGLPAIRSLCTSTDALARLVWVSAGVPRDALSIFSQAMTRTALSNGRKVSVSSVNIASSETVNVKMKELDADASEDAVALKDLFQGLQDFALKQNRKNAFLVEINNNDTIYQKIIKLIDLRLLHVISEGTSTGDVGKKYLALIIDYGFYTGIRAARSVDLFNKQTKKVLYRDLRTLPVYAK